MTFTFNQKTLLILMSLIMRLLWVFDAVTNVNVKTAGRALRYILVMALLIALGRVAYSYKYSSDILLGALYSTNGYPSDFLTDYKPRPVEYPMVVEDIRVPYISAKAVLVMDKGNDKPLLEINSDMSLAPASTTKLMTALVAIEIYSSDQEIIITDDCAAIDSTKAYLTAGANYKVRDLIEAMLVSSAGDAACAIASGKVAVEEFVGLMNAKAKQLGMDDTRFSNAIGLDGNGNHRSTAKDLYKLSVSAMQYPLISEAVKQKVYSISSTDHDAVAFMNNTNRLLWDVEGTLGIKTGTTAEAGEVLIYENSDGKRDLVIIVMSSQDRFGDTTKLLNWASKKYLW